jgi:sec-independent protein translocase protein TatA
MFRCVPRKLPPSTFYFLPHNRTAAGERRKQMPGFGPTELLLILLLVLIIFGAGKLPQVFRSLGSGIKEFREASEGRDTPTTTTTTTTTTSTPGGTGAAVPPANGTSVPPAETTVAQTTTQETTKTRE